MRGIVTARDGGEPGLVRRLKVPALLGGIGGLGLLGCVACCTLPLLGVIGIGSGAAAMFRIIEPLSAGLLALGGLAAVAAFVRFRRKSCAAPIPSEGASCSTEGACGCGPGPSPREPAGR
jgi:hypothetical protein